MAEFTNQRIRFVTMYGLTDHVIKQQEVAIISSPVMRCNEFYILFSRLTLIVHIIMLRALLMIPDVLTALYIQLKTLFSYLKKL